MNPPSGSVVLGADIPLACRANLVGVAVSIFKLGRQVGAGVTYGENTILTYLS